MAVTVWTEHPGPPGRLERKVTRELTAIRVLRDRLEWLDRWVPQEPRGPKARRVRRALPGRRDLRGPRGMRVRRPKPARPGSQVRS